MTASGDRELSGWIGKARKLVMGHLVGKVAVVAGASKGIGAGIAKELARHGASVVVNYAKSKAQTESVVDDITQAGGKATAVAASVDKAEGIEQLFAETKRVYGILDILVNNAGVYVFGLIEAFALDDISKMFRANVIGLLLATKASLPLFFQCGTYDYQHWSGRLSALWRIDKCRQETASPYPQLL
jgi:NAD(P)-dependent dehydrogenase (short-subunit alcohol dehydrogenase family)